MRLAGADGVGAVVERTPQLPRPTLVAVDGVDGSGKTTYAARLAAAYEEQGRRCVTVHLDDFLSPRATRYRLGRHSPRGFFLDTYDLAAFEACVLTPLAGDPPREVVPGVFDHRRDRPAQAATVEVPDGAVVVVEGMFLHRDELAARWDLSVFLDVPFEVTVARLAARDGSHPDPDHPSMSRYVEGQRLYLEACRPADRADVVLQDAGG